MGRLPILLALLIALTGCGVSKSAFSPVKKYSPQQLERDYSLYQKDRKSVV